MKETAEGYFNRAVEYHKKGEFSNAAKMYKLALQDDPDNKRAYVLLGNVDYHLGDLKDALRNYQKAIELDQEYAIAYFNLGSVYEDLGDLEHAKINLQKAIDINPDYAEAYSSLGTVLKELGDIEGAIKCFQKAMEINEDLEAPKKGISELMENIHEQLKEKEVTKTAEELIKDGAALEDSGDLETAIKKYSEAVRVNPNSFIGYFFLGLAQEKAGDISSALQSYKKILEMDPEIATKDISNEILDLLKKRMYIQDIKELVNVIKGFSTASKKDEQKSLLEYVKRDTIERRL